jgi:hypothetical protein
MKKLLLIISILGLSVACSDRTYVTNNVEPDTIEGLYTFEETDSKVISGQLEISINYEGKVTLSQKQSFITQNDNLSYGTLPNISRSGLTSNGDLLANYARNLNYTSNNDIEEDLTNDNIIGQKYTRVTLVVDTDNKLLLTVFIHEGADNQSGGANKVVAVRSFKSL